MCWSATDRLLEFAPAERTASDVSRPFFERASIAPIRCLDGSRVVLSILQDRHKRVFLVPAGWMLLFFSHLVEVVDVLLLLTLT
mmetsp:Transcript_23129/g.52500  ORF Transcript_23129/g.52500 Transcript_23129/m.52500 type:complete len:84 (-) Transcript_23129:202-453(-)